MNTDRSKTLRMVMLAMMVAIGVVISPILRIEGMCPTAHLINIVCSVLLGPWYSLLCATLIGIIRMMFMGIPPLALTGAVFGAFLSGGVDSGYLASSSGADQAFTVGFDEGDRYSEVNKAAKVAEKAGLKHHVKIISKQEFWDALPDVMYHMDEPLADASAVALYFLSKEAAGHVKVVLSGEGADELFGGYNIYREPHDLAGFQKLPYVF